MLEGVLVALKDCLLHFELDFMARCFLISFFPLLYSARLVVVVYPQVLSHGFSSTIRGHHFKEKRLVSGNESIR